MIIKILVVEDDNAIQEYLKDILSDYGYQVEAISDGAAALSEIKKSLPDLVILDLGLPTITGEAVCQEIKKKYFDLPVIMLTGKDSTSDIVHGLTLGADDYITKPFEADELIARIKARLRHSDQAVLQVDDLTLNNKTYEVRRDGKIVMLSPHEFKLLQYLMGNQERVLTREMILNRVWQYSYDVDTRVVDVYIGYLRKKIDKGFKKKLIRSIRGFGYMIRA